MFKHDYYTNIDEVQLILMICGTYILLSLCES
jgi:hypothetical protein